MRSVSLLFSVKVRNGTVKYIALFQERLHVYLPVSLKTNWQIRHSWQLGQA